MAISESGDCISSRIRESLILLHHFLSGHLPPIDYRLDSLPDSWPVILLSDAMWNDKPGPHGFGRMAWMVWFPVGDTDGELVYAGRGRHGAALVVK